MAGKAGAPQAPTGMPQKLGCTKPRSAISALKIDPKLHKRIPIRLDRLNVVTTPEQMNLPGFNFHTLKRFVPTRYTVHVNGPCV